MHTSRDGLVDYPKLYDQAGTSMSSEPDTKFELVSENDGSVESADAVQEKIQQGLHCMLNAEFARAIDIFTAALQLDQTHPIIHAHRGDAYRLLCVHDKALADFNTAIRLDPTQPSAYMSRGLVHRSLGKFDAAIADFCEALLLNPENGAAYLNRASAYAELAKQDQAIEDFSVAIRLNAYDLQAYLQRGKAYSQRGDYCPAIADFSRVIELSPNYILAYLHRGDAYRQKGDYPLAIVDYSEVLRLHPGNALAFGKRAQVSELLGDGDRALADYSEAIRLDGSQANVYCSRGILYRLKKKHELALADFDKALQIAPKNAPAYFHRGMVRMARNEFSLAIDSLDQAILLSPEFVLAYLNRALAYDRREQYRSAIEDCTKAIAIDPKLAAAYVIRGTVHSHGNAYSLAIADLSEAIRIDSTFAAAYLERARAYTQRRAFNEALADYDRLLKLEPANSFAFANRGIVYHLMGDHHRAMDDFGHALKLDSKRILAGWHHGLGELARRQSFGLLSDYTEGRRPINPEGAKRPTARLQPEKPPIRNQDNLPASSTKAITEHWLTPDDIEPESASTDITRSEVDSTLSTLSGSTNSTKPHDSGSAPTEQATKSISLSGTIEIEKSHPNEKPAPTVKAVETMPEIVLDPDEILEKTMAEEAEPEDEETAGQEATFVVGTQREIPTAPVTMPTRPTPVLGPIRTKTMNSARPKKNVDYDEPGFWERRKKTVSIAAIALMLVGSVTLLSSGAPRKVRVYPAHGQVTFEGEAVPDAVVDFYPVGSANADVPRPRGKVKEDGTFVLGTYGKDDGAPPGEYTVTVQCYRKVRPEDEGFGVNILPGKYAAPKTSNLTAKIQIGENQIPTIELTR